MAMLSADREMHSHQQMVIDNSSFRRHTWPKVSVGSRDAASDADAGDNRQKKTVARWSLTRTALEQSSIFLSTLDVRYLAGACSSLQTFIQNASGGGYWDECKPQCARGKYCPKDAWLHSLSSLRSSTRFIMIAKDLQVLGTATFFKRGELASLTEILHQESAHDGMAGNTPGYVASRFFIPWQFRRECITDLLEGSSLEAAGVPVRFRCKYGVSFALQLVVSKAFSDSPELTFRLDFVESLGAKYLAPAEIEISGSIIAPDMASSIVKLKTVTCGSHSGKAEEDSEFAAGPTNSKFCLNWLNFKELTSLVRVRVPRWLETTTLV
jgi:hypothetical protein